MPNESRQALLSQQLAQIRDEYLYARDPIAALHSEMHQLLQNIRQANRDIQDDYNHKRHLANLPPIEFSTHESDTAGAGQVRI